jgi:hypothetical protein
MRAVPRACGGSRRLWGNVPRATTGTVESVRFATWRKAARLGPPRAYVSSSNKVTSSIPAQLHGLIIKMSDERRLQ